MELLNLSGITRTETHLSTVPVNLNKIVRRAGNEDWHFDNLNSSSESGSQVVYAAAIDDIKVLFKKRVEVYYQV